MSFVDRRAVGKALSAGIVGGALLLAVVVIGRVVRHPQTDDATVMADVINVVLEVADRIVELHVVDNQAVKQGDLLLSSTRGPTSSRSRTAGRTSRRSTRRSR
jgi:membrane fusion protein, multidrug efflux system